jgi:hypothetical protein
MANEIFEASAGFLVGTGEGAKVLLGGLARKCTVGRSSTPDQRRRAESVDMSGCARRWKTEVSQHRFGDLKLFEPKTMWPIIAVREREGR